MTKRERTAAQIAAEARREANSLGKLTVRHTEESKRAIGRLRRRFRGSSDPEIARLAIVELDARKN